MDGLKPSDFLIAQAKENIEGRISTQEVGRRLEEYYSQKSVRDRTLHILWNETKPQNDVLEGAKRQNDVLGTSSIIQGKLSLKEMAVVQRMLEGPKIAITQIASKTRLSKRTVDRIISSLKERQIVTRLGTKNNATWEVIAQ